MRATAAVFDMDGTLVDNMRFHADAWVEMAARFGVDLGLERFEASIAGRKNDEIFPDLLGRALAADELARLGHEKERLYRERAAGKIEAVAGLVGFLDRLAARQVRLAVATAAPPENRALVFDVLGLHGRFEHVVGAEHATRGKPAPDLFLAAARLLDVDPRHCVAFEDAPNGVRAAVAAGMRCVGVVTTTGASSLLEAGAFCTIQRYDELPAALEELL